MKTLAPAQMFLRVADKFFADFVLWDAELNSGATLLYLILFRLAGQRDHCWPSQAYLAGVCKCSERTIQSHLQQLVTRDYVRIERRGAQNVYRLLLSPRVQDLLQQTDTDMLPLSPVSSIPSVTEIDALKAQKTAERGADFSHNIRSKQEQNTPLSPQRERPSVPLPSVSLPQANQRGGLSFAVQEGNLKILPRRDAQLEFEQLYAAWPKKQDKLNASRVYVSLAQAGTLPPLDALLAVVERFKTQDRAWRNGYPPNLRFWLQGQRWTDEILPIIGSTVPTASVPLAALQPASPSVPEQGEIDAIKRENTSPLTRTADALSALCPTVPRGKIMSQIILAGLRGLNFETLQGRIARVQPGSPASLNRLLDMETC